MPLCNAYLAGRRFMVTAGGIPHSLPVIKYSKCIKVFSPTNMEPTLGAESLSYLLSSSAPSKELYQCIGGIEMCALHEYMSEEK